MPYNEGEFIATSIKIHKHCYHIGQVFKVGAANTLHVCARHDVNGSIIVDTGDTIEWGSRFNGNIITKSKTKCVTVSCTNDTIYLTRLNFTLWQAISKTKLMSTDHIHNLMHAGYFLGVSCDTFAHIDGLTSERETYFI